MAGGLIRLVHNRATRIARARARARALNARVRRPLARPKRMGMRRVMPAFNDASPFPPHKMYRLVYTDRINLNSADGIALTGAQHVYQLNSLFDPDFTAVGHQPYGFDALAVAYNRYKVVGCKVELTLTDPTNDGLVCLWSVLNPSNPTATIASTDPTTIREQQMSGSAYINDSGSQVKKVKFFVPMYKAAGLTKLQFNSDPDNYTADVTSDPGNKIRLAIALADVRTHSPASQLLCNVKLTYSAVFFQRKIMAQS